MAETLKQQIANLQKQVLTLKEEKGLIKQQLQEAESLLQTQCDPKRCGAMNYLCDESCCAWEIKLYLKKWRLINGEIGNKTGK